MAENRPNHAEEKAGGSNTSDLDALAKAAADALARKQAAEEAARKRAESEPDPEEEQRQALEALDRYYEEHQWQGDEDETPDETAAPQDVPATQDNRRDEEMAELEEALRRQQALTGDYLDQLKRTRAEFDNYRKRTRKEQERLRRQIKNEAYLQLLPVADNLERAVAAAKEHEEELSDVGRSLVQGVDFVLRSLHDVFRREGIERLEVVGKPFDPATQEAVSVQPSDEYEPDTVMNEVLAGYVADGQVLRPAKVVVAKKASVDA